ncbi:MAG: DNA polymerase III subunit delta [Bacilli bacterium]|nr:DNA polymerase III subunit delta [Bacilli bacterium]
MYNTYLLYGTDKGVINNELIKIINNTDKNDITRYSIDSITIEDIITDVSTISMFGNKRIIIVEDAYIFTANKTIENIITLENYLKNNKNNNCLIFITYSEKVDTRKKIYKLIKDKGKIIECKNGDNNYLHNFINNYIEKAGYRIENINYFLSIVGNNLDNIKNELDKLFMYKVNDKKIINSDIDNICIKVIEDEIFSLTDAIILNDTNKSIILLEEFLKKKYDEIYILNLLANQFRFLFQVKRLANKNKSYNEIAKILEVNPYRVKFTLNKLYNYTESDLLSRIKMLAEADKKIKLGLMDKKLALELFIIKK